MGALGRLYFWLDSLRKHHILYNQILEISVKTKREGRLVYIFQLCNFPSTAKEEGFEKSAISFSFSPSALSCSLSLGCCHLYVAQPHVTRQSTEIKEMKQ